MITASLIKAINPQLPEARCVEIASGLQTAAQAAQITTPARVAARRFVAEGAQVLLGDLSGVSGDLRYLGHVALGIDAWVRAGRVVPELYRADGQWWTRWRLVGGERQDRGDPAHQGLGPFDMRGVQGHLGLQHQAQLAVLVARDEERVAAVLVQGGLGVDVERIAHRLAQAARAGQLVRAQGEEPPIGRREQDRLEKGLARAWAGSPSTTTSAPSSTAAASEENSSASGRRVCGK